MTEQAVVVATARTPIGRAFKGSLKDIRPDDLAATAVRAALDKVPALDPNQIEDLVLGCGNPVGEHGSNMARIVALLLGLDDVPGTTVSRYCASSVQAVGTAMNAIAAGQGDVFVAAGVESVSRLGNVGNIRNPRFAEAEERTAEMSEGGRGPWSPTPGLPDPYIGMGQTAENVAELRGISREEMDEFAARSQQRAGAAIERGFFAAEITPVTAPDGTVVDKDDSPRAGTTVEKLATLQPVFRPGGSVTAGNSCPLNDGAAAVVVMSATRARELGLQPLARLVAVAASALNPEIMGLGPVESSRRVLKRAGMSIDDVDLVEINEAFAAQVIPSMRDLAIDPDKLNVNGGAIALGHPYGMTGARILTTLIHSLQETDRTVGLETMCVAGGQGMALIVERLA